ncbi:unnamed protein product [Caenorhabditis sp. 36 PRJEB53466]|nr:unnamed protein product [Caenorhabditis sp. 36 PRJEB53466]
MPGPVSMGTGGPMPPTVMPPGALTIPPPPVPPAAGGPGPIPALPIDSIHKTANDACIKRLRQLNIEPEQRVYPKPGDPNPFGIPMEVQTNVFGLEITKKVKVYQYIVHIKTDLTPTKEAVFTKKSRNDFIVLDRHEKCCNIFFGAVDAYSDFFKMGEGNSLIYDGQSLLFTTIDLFSAVADADKKTRLMEVNGANVQNDDLKTLSCIKVEVYASKNPPLILSEKEISLRTADSHIAANNRGYQQLLELTMNQHCIRDTTRFACFEKGKLFFMNPGIDGYEEGDCVLVGDGKYMLPGIRKSVQYIEGPFGRGQNNPSVVIDSIKVAFHREQFVSDKIMEILCKEQKELLRDGDKDRLVPIIKGLDCHSTYTGRTRHLQIDGIHKGNAKNSQFELKSGQSITVQEYMKEKYNINLAYPELNLLICKDRGNQNFYPMELMKITKHQRVTIPQTTAVQMQRSIKESAVLPNVRQRLIMTGKTAAVIDSANPVFSALGVTVCPEPLQTRARQLECPVIEFSSRAATVESGKWRASSARYIRPANPPKIWAIYAVGTTKSKFLAEDMRKFSREFVIMCNSKGIDIGGPSDCRLVPIDDVEYQLDAAAKANCTFALMITDDSIVHVHQKYKVIERDRQMIVQDMLMSKASSVLYQNKRLTLENVVNKTNVKLGGINYLVTDQKRRMDDLLIIGIGNSIVSAGGKFELEGKGFLHPQVVGFSCNAIANWEYSGDFLLSAIGQDTLAPVEDIVKQCLYMYKKQRGKSPRRVVVYRSGAAQGAHGSIISYEIPLARAAMKEVDPAMQLIYIVVSKDHTYRFFKENLDQNSGKTKASATAKTAHPSGGMASVLRASDLNIPPGVMLDSVITNPGCKQFFLNSHTTLQGTAKTPLYTVLADDLNAPLFILEDLTYALCHNHQIVNMTTSVPTPLYVANEYAKRGRNLWIERTSAKGPIARGTGSEWEQLQEATAEISYKNAGSLLERRVNA